MYNNIIRLEENEPEIRKIFVDCYDFKMSEYDIMQKIFYLIGGGNTYRNFKESNPSFSREDLTNAIDCIIKKLNLNVNEPCYEGGQDLMYHAIKYGTAHDVEILLKNGYDSSNYISGETVYGYLMWDFPEYEEKKELFKRYGQNKIKKDSSTADKYKCKEVIDRQKSRLRVFDIKEFMILFRNSPVAREILRSGVSLNEDKATAKIVTKLVDLGISPNEIKSILENGSFTDFDARIYDVDMTSRTRKRKKLDSYYKLLESEGIELSKENINVNNSTVQEQDSGQPGL